MSLHPFPRFPKKGPGLPVLGLSAICLVLVFSFAASQVDPSAAWLKSKDPCFQIKQLKNADNIKCFPVHVNLTWEVEEKYQHYSPVLGTDRAKLKMTDEFEASLVLYYNQKDRSLIDHIVLSGPAPCCPGQVDSVLQNIDCRKLICKGGGKNCRPFETQDPVLFAVIPGEDPCFTFSWERLGNKGQALVEADSASVFIKDGAIKEPYGDCSGVLEETDGGTFHVHAAAEDALEKQGAIQLDALVVNDIIQLLDEGVAGKSIPFRESSLDGAANELHTTEGTLTVDLEYFPEEEVWSVSVEGWEQDRTQPDIYNPALKTPLSTLPIRVEYGWKLQADVVLKKLKGWRVFKEGTVKSAEYKPKIMFDHPDLYDCGIVDCPGKDSLSGISGAFLQGQVDENTLSLKWPPFNPETCVKCTPRKKNLGKKAYQGTFESTEFLSKISGEVLPLKDGYSVERKISNWMGYRITLKRIK
jgi:hypothetical protein